MARYRVTLTEEERKELATNFTKGRHSARSVLYARALLLLDKSEEGPGYSNKKVAEFLGIGLRTLDGLKKKFVEEGLEVALERKERETPPTPKIFDGRFEAELIKLACSECPAGYSRWTIRLLRDKMIELKIVPTVSAMTICNTLKKTNLNLTSANTGKFHQKKIVRS